MKNKKILKIIVFILVALMVSSFILFRILFSPQRIKNVLIRSASAALDMHVDISDVSLRPGQLSLRNVEIKPWDIEEKTAPRISVRRIRMGFRIISLFRGRFVFNNININRADINIESFPSAEDIENIFQRSQQRHRESIQFEVTKVGIKNSRLKVESPEIELSGMDLDVRASILRQAFIVSAAADVNRDHLERVEMKGEIDLLRKRGSIENITLLGSGGRLKGSGTISNITQAPHTEIRYTMEEFPYGLFPEDFEIKGMPVIRGDAEQKDGVFYINWDADFTGIEFKSDGNIYKASGRRLRSRGGISYAGDTAAINWYIFEAGPDTFSGTGTVDTSGAVEISVRGDNINLKNMGEFFPHIERYVGDGYSEFRGSIYAAGGSASFEGRLNMRDLKVRNLHALSSLYERLVSSGRGKFLFETADADIFIDRDRFVLRSLSASGPDLRGTGSGTLIWNEDADFIFYPHIRGARIGIRVFGSPDNIRISLK